MQPEREKTALAFHAKDDLPEIRWEVFKLLRESSIRFFAVVRDKQDLAKTVLQRNEQEPGYRYKDDEQYDILVSELFRKFRHSADEVRICFAVRGNKNRTAAIARALKNADAEFERSYGFPNRAKLTIGSSTPPKNTGLQAVDYYLWALQRFYERGESRFLEMIWPQVGEVHDLDQVENRRKGVIYNQTRPLVPPSGERA